jgi:hypothetical protein
MRVEIQALLQSEIEDRETHKMIKKRKRQVNRDHREWRCHLRGKKLRNEFRSRKPRILETWMTFWNHLATYLRPRISNLQSQMSSHK